MWLVALFDSCCCVTCRCGRCVGLWCCVVVRVGGAVLLCAFCFARCFVVGLVLVVVCVVLCCVVLCCVALRCVELCCVALGWCWCWCCVVSC